MGNKPPAPSGNLSKSPVRSVTVERKKYYAEIMIFATVFKGKTLAEAWREAHPESKANDSTAKVNAHNEIEWYRYNHPLAMSQLLHLHKLGADEMIGQLKEHLAATRPLKTGSTKKISKLDDGETVTEEEVIYTEVIDWKTRSDALQKWIELAGHAAKRNPLKAEATQSDEQQVTEITDPGTLSEDEWRKQYAIIQSAKREDRIEKMIRDAEDRKQLMEIARTTQNGSE